MVPLPLHDWLLPIFSHSASNFWEVVLTTPPISEDRSPLLWVYYTFYNLNGTYQYLQVGNRCLHTYWQPFCSDINSVRAGLHLNRPHLHTQSSGTPCTFVGYCWLFQVQEAQNTAKRVQTQVWTPVPSFPGCMVLECYFNSFCLNFWISKMSACERYMISYI